MIKIVYILLCMTQNIHKKFYEPQLVMSIHGILSTGKWQTKLSEIIRRKGLVSTEYNYGFTVRFDSFKVNNLVNNFKEWYFRIIEDQSNAIDIRYPYYRPSIVAHSLGSWIIVKALQKYPEIKFDKIFLHGSIVPHDFDWYSLILQDQVNKVITEKSKKDLIVRLGFMITGKFKPCCTNGFLQQSTYLKYEDVTHFRHSDFQYKNRFIAQMDKHLYEAPVQLKVVEGGELDMKIINRYFKQTRKIDFDVYGPDYQNDPISLDVVKSWAEVEKNIWSFMIDSYSGKVLGYINTMIIDDETMDNFLTGNLKESDIKASNIKMFSMSGNVNVLIMSIALSKMIKQNYGGLLSSKPGELLITALSHKLSKTLGKNKKLNKIASVAWSPVGENLCKSFGMNKTTTKYMQHPIYCISRAELKKKSAKDVHPLCSWWLNRIKEKT